MTIFLKDLSHTLPTQYDIAPEDDKSYFLEFRSKWGGSRKEFKYAMPGASSEAEGECNGRGIMGSCK